ncbi:MAG: NAD(P)-dependent oxidoreductase [Candidatus Korobacteraceae bacterium]|jgi:3-hydroxyisobutyrate dehydrogenase
MQTQNKHAIGWIGCGRMGYAMSECLAKAGCKLAVWNRTRSKAEPLAAVGAKVVNSPAELAGCDIVFTMVAASDDFKEVTIGPKGLVSAGKAPRILVDCTSVSIEASAEVRQKLASMDCKFLACPVSGNAKVVRAGKLSAVASGPKDAFAEAGPYISMFAQAGVSYVGEGELARIAKICHNVMLGVVAQNMAEIVILAEKAGLPRSAFLAFMNASVMGSVFTRYKGPAYVNLDFTPTFTPVLLRKDLDLGLALGKKLDVPMPTSAVARDVLQAHMGYAVLKGGGYIDKDFATLLEFQAHCSGIEIKPENVEVWDGLSPKK